MSQTAGVPRLKRMKKDEIWSEWRNMGDIFSIFWRGFQKTGEMIYAVIIFHYNDWNLFSNKPLTFDFCHLWMIFCCSQSISDASIRLSRVLVVFVGHISWSSQELS